MHRLLVPFVEKFQDFTSDAISSAEPLDQSQAIKFKFAVILNSFILQKISVALLAENGPNIGFVMLACAIDRGKGSGNNDMKFLNGSLIVLCV